MWGFIFGIEIFLWLMPAGIWWLVATSSIAQNNQRTSYAWCWGQVFIKITYLWLDSYDLHCEKKLEPYTYVWLVGLMAGRKKTRPADENIVVQVCLKFNNMTTNAYILVLNRFLTLITYWTNLVLPLVLQHNIIRPLVLLHYR